MFGKLEGTPFALLHNLKHNRVLHQRVIILTIIVEEAARVAIADRVKIERLAEAFYRVVGYYGFMEEPKVLGLSCAAKELKVNIAD